MHDDMTTDPGQKRSVVPPNMKCSGCLHFDANRLHCLVASAPAVCGDGSAPKTGYNPIVAQSLPVQYPAAPNQPAPEFETRDLGDEGYQPVSKGERPRGSFAGPTAKVAAPAKAKRPRGSFSGPTAKIRQPKAFDSKKTAKKFGGPVSKGEPGTPVEAWAIISAAWDKLPKQKKAHYDNLSKSSGMALKRTGVSLFGERLLKKGGKSLVEEFGHKLAGVLFKARHELRKAVLTALPKLKGTAQYAQQGDANRESTKTHKTAVTRVPGNRPSAGSSAGTVAGKRPAAGSGNTSTHVRPKTGSPVMHAVRQKQMAQPSQAAHNKAARIAGGKKFSHHALAKTLGVHPDKLADLAHGSAHSYDFHNKVRAKFGDKVKHLTSGQIRSAYHSTGLMHSMNADIEKGFHKDWNSDPNVARVKGLHINTQPHGQYTVKHGKAHELHFASGTGRVRHLGSFSSLKQAKQAAHAHHMKRTAMGKSERMTDLLPEDLDLIKAHVSKRRHVIGHTSSGKAVTNDAHGADAFNREEHDEAAQLHSDLASRLSDAAYGFSNHMGPGNSQRKLPPAAFKYVNGLARHHEHIAARHRKTGYQLMDKQYASGAMPKVEEIKPFGKSLGTSDAEIAAAMLNGGGAGSITQGGNLRTGFTFGLPSAQQVVVKPAAPKAPEPKRITVGGCQSAARDLGTYVE